MLQFSIRFKTLFGLFLLFCNGIIEGYQQIPTHRQEYNYQHIQPYEVANNYQLLKLTDQLFERQGIFYWAWGGTLLGAIRHGGFIPWDLDTDVCIYESDQEKFFACAKDFAQYDTYILPCKGVPNHYRLKKIKQGVPLFGHVDVYFMREIDGKIHYIFKKEEQTNHFFFPFEVARVMRIPFGPISIMAPEDFMPYLYRAYGQDVLKMAEIMYINNPKTGKKYPKFEIKNFSPALYEMIDSSIPLDNSPLF
jgi:hypothetical protein